MAWIKATKNRDGKIIKIFQVYEKVTIMTRTTSLRFNRSKEGINEFKKYIGIIIGYSNYRYYPAEIKGMNKAKHEEENGK